MPSVFGAPTAKVNPWMRQAEIPFHPPASPAGTGLCWPEKRLRTLGVTDRAMIKGKGSEGRGQTAKEGPALPEAVPRVLR